MAGENATVSNLLVRSNLLSRGYQQEFSLISVFELRDIHGRAPLLGINLDPSQPNKVSREQRAQWTAHLFWGDRTVGMHDEDRYRAWLELLAESVFGQVAELETQPEEEPAFELLYVTEHLQRVNSHHASRAAQMSARIRVVLKRDEFGYSDDQIDSRLRDVTGDKYCRTETADADQSAGRRQRDPKPLPSVSAHNI
jgi:hypothetical protein